MAATKSITGKKRLDQALVEQGRFKSRSRVRDAIRRGTVRIDGQVVRKPGLMVTADSVFEIDDPAQDYVSRAALKLIAGLDHFGFDPAGKVALDIGASTGGFTQVLLERGAAHVIALDVGHDQLDPTLKGDRRVTVLEGLNARDLSERHLEGSPPEIIVSDVSFISLKLTLPPALRLAAPGAFGLFLVKPQFEAGREAIGKGGLLRDPAAGGKIAEDLSAWLNAFPGWRSLGICNSPVTGGDGNHEFLLGGRCSR